MSVSSLRSADLPVAFSRGDGERALQRFIGVWGGLATCYTAIAAMGAAHGLPVGFSLISAIEVALLGVGMMVVLFSGVRDSDWPPLVFLYFMIALTVLLSIVNERPLIETIRTTLIITVFALLGQRCSPRTLDITFLSITIIVLGVLGLELTSTSSYVWLLQPQRFYEATRGMSASKYNSTGLFNATAGFASRFSFGIFTDHRTGSIFLEQVGNANFASVLALYTMARWQSLSLRVRALCVTTIVAILITTNARFASAMVVMLALGYFLFSYMPRLLLPAVSIGIAAVASMVGIFRYDALGDNMVGRIANTVRTISEAGAGFLLGGEASQGLLQLDSGYAYIIGSTSIFGLAAIWVFVNYYPRADDSISRRLNWGVVIYIFGQLIVSGTSLFSIKTAALLWMLIGFIRVQPRIDPDGKLTGRETS